MTIQLMAKVAGRALRLGGAILLSPIGILLAALLCTSMPADAAAPRQSFKTKQVRGIYVKPTDPAHGPVYDMVRQRRVLERLSEFLSPLRLPRRLTIKFQGCEGEVNAYYSDDEIIVCYEYFAFILESAPKQTTVAGLQPDDAIIGPAVDVILHEVGHAVFDMLKIPILGREEDAADLFSAFILLNFAKDDARRLVLGVAHLGGVEALETQKKNAKLQDFADEHGTPAQRYFNLICMAYGSDPVLFRDATTLGRLPEGRAEGCAEEYDQLKHAFDKLIRPYISRPLLRQVRAKKWFRFAPSPQTQ
jgi:hypothetical protein